MEFRGTNAKDVFGKLHFHYLSLYLKTKTLTQIFSLHTITKLEADCRNRTMEELHERRTSFLSLLSSRKHTKTDRPLSLLSREDFLHQHWEMSVCQEFSSSALSKSRISHHATLSWKNKSPIGLNSSYESYEDPESEQEMFYHFAFSFFYF